MQAIRWFEDIRLGDTGSVGGKGANLGELTAGGLPVPPGFVVTGEAYLDALARAGVRERLVGHPGRGSRRPPRTTSTAWPPRRRISCTRCLSPMSWRARCSPPTSASGTMSAWPCGPRASARTPRARRLPA